MFSLPMLLVLARQKIHRISEAVCSNLSGVTIARLLPLFHRLPPALVLRLVNPATMLLIVLAAPPRMLDRHRLHRPPPLARPRLQRHLLLTSGAGSSLSLRLWLVPLFTLSKGSPKWRFIPSQTEFHECTISNDAIFCRM